jgi:hypothetical protein
MRIKRRTGNLKTTVRFASESGHGKSRVCIVYIAIYCSIAIAILRYIGQYDIAILGIALV